MIVGGEAAVADAGVMGAVADALAGAADTAEEEAVAAPVAVMAVAGAAMTAAATTVAAAEVEAAMTEVVEGVAEAVVTDRFDSIFAEGVSSYGDAFRFFDIGFSGILATGEFCTRNPPVNDQEN